MECDDDSFLHVPSRAVTASVQWIYYGEAGDFTPEWYNRLYIEMKNRRGMLPTSLIHFISKSISHHHHRRARSIAIRRFPETESFSRQFSRAAKCGKGGFDLRENSSCAFCCVQGVPVPVYIFSPLSRLSVLSRCIPRRRRK